MSFCLKPQIRRCSRDSDDSLTKCLEDLNVLCQQNQIQTTTPLLKTTLENSIDESIDENTRESITSETPSTSSSVRELFQTLKSSRYYPSTLELNELQANQKRQSKFPRFYDEVDNPIIPQKNPKDLYTKHNQPIITYY